MNEVSIIINGVRYDAVDAPKAQCACSYCDAIDDCIGHNEDVLCAIHNVIDKIFKKSDEKFEE